MKILFTIFIVQFCFGYFNIYAQSVSPYQPNSMFSVWEETIGNTYYDLQSHSSSQNRVYYFNDGTIGTVFTMSPDYPNPGFENRGTGYNYFDGNSWGPLPTESLESQRTGFPVYAPLGENGEIIVSHLSEAEQVGLVILTRENKGMGDWTEQIFTGPEGFETLYWPSMTTGGVDHNTIHILALTEPGNFGGNLFEGQDGALLYSRSIDGGLTFGPHNMVLPGMDSAFYKGFFGHSYFMRAKGDNVAIVFGDFYYDMVLMKSTDGGENWEKTVIWEHPYPLLDPETVISTDTFFCVDGAVHLDFDVNDNVHVVFGISKAVVVEGTDYLKWFTEVDGIGYWNENRDTFSNHINALSPYGDPGSELIEDYSLVGWSQDINGNNQLDTLGEWGQYYVGFSSMPQIVIEEFGIDYRIFVVYSSVTETFDNGVQDYRHLWVRVGINEGEWWGYFTMLTADLVHIFDECVFPSLAEVTDEAIFLVYQKDMEPGLAVWGDEDPPGENNQVFMEVPFYIDLDKNKEIAEFSVSPINPNPFNEFTNVFVDLKISSELELIITDITGRVVHTEYLGCFIQGKHKIIINRNRLSSGIYFLTT
ncbi:MAG: T9SS type A sorting domain-containing protein, partial [Bacteroidales bacterium]|nr:T9SS type A sorting domain-containing protein [Bacteroidales bacterium]